MKKLVLTSVCTLAVAGAAFAQGNVNWGSISFTAMTAQTNSQTYSPLTGGGATGSGSVGATLKGTDFGTAGAGNGTSFYYELLYTTYSGTQAANPTTTAQLATWSDAGLGATNSNNAGRLAVVNANAGAQVPWSPGTTDSIMLVGWSANLGSTYAAALAALQNGTYTGTSYFGESNTGYITPLSTSTSPGANVFGPPTAQGVPIVSLNTQLYLLTPVAPVPEPGTIAMAAFGGLSLLALRRKK